MTISSVIERFSPGAADHLKPLFDAALDAVVGMEHDGKIIAWNRTAESCFGWARKDVLGRSLSETIIPEPLWLSAAIFLPTRHFAGPQFLLREKFARPQDA